MTWIMPSESGTSSWTPPPTGDYDSGAYREGCSRKRESLTASGIPNLSSTVYNALIKEDKINSTPTCVVVRNGQKKAFVGGPDIVNALKFLKTLQ